MFWASVPNNSTYLIGIMIEGHNIFFNKFIYLFIYLFLAALGLCCCMRASSSCGERGLLFVAVCGLLIAVASLAVEHRFYVHGLQ